MTDEPMTEANKKDQEEEPSVNFVSFILSLTHTAALHFGDVADPSTGKPGKANLPAAQQIIDILNLLSTKTKGNLSTEERQLLEQVLYELRLRFVEAKKAESPIIQP
tara:strand:- start:1433 stop:1753 length:321 start_codon:yes stop_codon:yes gene_type:complete